MTVEVKHAMGPVTWWENIPVFLPKSVKSNQKQLQHIIKLSRPFVEFSTEIFNQRMSYSVRQNEDSLGNLRLSEVFSETRKNARQANTKCGRDIRS